MTKSLIYSLIFHSVIILLTILSLPFMIRQPVDLPPIVSVELIQISDKTIFHLLQKLEKLSKKPKKKRKELYQSKHLLQQKQKKSPIGYPCQMRKKKKNK